MSRYHCCASCIHFRVEKKEGTSYACSRLGFATKPNYQFHCWTPNESVKKRLEKEKKWNEYGKCSKNGH